MVRRTTMWWQVLAHHNCTTPINVADLISRINSGRQNASMVNNYLNYYTGLATKALYVSVRAFMCTFVRDVCDHAWLPNVIICFIRPILLALTLDLLSAAGAMKW